LIKVVLEYLSFHANGGGRDAVSAISRLLQRCLAGGIGMALALLGAGCSGPVSEPAAAEVEAAPYPDLYSVPPPPILSDSLPQRKQLGDALGSDLAMARYQAALVRDELGLAGAPPAAQPPTLIEEPEPVPGGVPAVPPPGPPPPLVAGGGEIAELAVRQQVLTERNNGRLDSFLRIMERQQQLDRRIEAAGLGRLPDAQEDTSNRPLPDPVATLTLDASRIEPPPGADQATLAAVSQTARTDNARLTVVGTGATQEIALQRARAVAMRLMRLGTPGGMISVRGAGPGNEVQIHLIRPAAA
jgi:hypothetical protein